MVEHGGKEPGLAGGLTQIGRVEAGRAEKGLDPLGFGSQEGEGLQCQRLSLIGGRSSYHGDFSRVSGLRFVNCSRVTQSSDDAANLESPLSARVFPARTKGGPMKTVLIVEDNELNMKLFNDLLEAHGYATLKTSDGIEAIELARTHHPALILMDIQLPEVSGLEVTKWIKEDDDLKSIPVVAVTAFAMKGDEERIREGGCEAYLSKPISVAKFLETVRTYAGAA